MNTLCYYYYRVREELFKRLHLFGILKTQVGLKNINAKMVQHLSKPINNDVFYLLPKDLFLGVDFLIDKYTLLKCPLENSPHLGLMKALRDDEELSQTEYIHRFESGTLDGRRGVPHIKDFSLYRTKFVQHMQEFNNNSIEPVLVYKVKERYYVYDGKHRAALCTLMGEKIPCKLVDAEDRFGYGFEIIAGDPKYGKHNVFREEFKSEPK